MKAVVCRVDHASVTVDEKVVGQIDRGLLVYLGIIEGDTQSDLQWMVQKLLALRLFNDDAGKMNLSVADVKGSLLLIPNFTLAGNTSKGTRPSYSNAADPNTARQMFEQAIELLAQQRPTQSGIFAAHMTITAQCDGPVTLIVDSRL